MRKAAPRKLAQELATFAADAQSKMESATSAAMCANQTRMLEAPAAVLGLDALVQNASDESMTGALQFLDRDAMASSFAEMGESEEVQEKHALRFEGVAAVASGRGAMFAGFLPVGLPTVYHHVLNEKVLVVIDLEEAISWFCQVNGIKQTLADFLPPPIKDGAIGWLG